MLKFLKENKSIIKKYLLMSFIGSISLFATLFANNKCNEINNRERAVGLVKKAHTDIYECRQSNIALFYLLDNESFARYWTKELYPNINHPDIFESVFKSEDVLSFVEQETLESIRSFKNKSKLLMTRLNSDSMSIKDAKMPIYQYGVELWNMEEILKITIKYMNTDISLYELDSLKQIIIRQRFESFSSPNDHPWVKLGK